MAKRGDGEGSIMRRKDGLWRGRVMVGTKPDGRPDVRNVYARTRGECLVKLDALRTRVRSGTLGAPTKERATLADYLENWLKATKSTIRLKTYHRYESAVRVHIIPALGKTKLPDLKADQIQRLYGEKQASGQSPQSVVHIHRILSRALSQGVRWGYCVRNVCDLVDPPKVSRHEMRTFTLEHARAFLAAAEGDPLEALYVLALTTGMRQGELRGLKWADLDLDAATLQVRRTLGRIKGQGFVETEPKSRQSRRRIDLDDLAVRVLRKHRASQLEQRLTAGPLWTDGDYVFCTAVGTPLEHGNILRRSFKPLMKRAGVPRIRFHDLRHTFASLMLADQQHPKVVQEMLGHSQISLTLDTYSHVVPSMKRDAAHRLGRMLDPVTKTG